MSLVLGKVYQRAQEAGKSAAARGHLVKTADAVMSASGTSPRPARYMYVRRPAAATLRAVKICLFFTSAVSAGRPPAPRVPFDIVCIAAQAGTKLEGAGGVLDVASQTMVVGATCSTAEPCWAAAAGTLDVDETGAVPTWHGIDVGMHAGVRRAVEAALPAAGLAIFDARFPAPACDVDGSGGGGDSDEEGGTCEARQVAPPLPPALPHPAVLAVQAGLTTGCCSSF